MAERVQEVPALKSLNDLMGKKYKTLGFEGEWLEHIGDPEISGSWVVWGGSGHGKTSYIMQLVKYLCEGHKVYYDSLEEKDRKSFRTAVERNGVAHVGSRFKYQTETYPMLVRRYREKNPPRIAIIDSLQYFFRGRTAEDYFNMVNEFDKTLFIFVSHASGRLPKGELAEIIMYHSDVKIEVRDFLATVHTSRFGGGKSRIVYEKGYRERTGAVI